MKTLVAVVLGVLVAGCAAPLSSPTPTSGASTTGSPTSLPDPSATATPTGTTSPSQVPGSSGTCSASQVVLGKAASEYGFGTFFKRVVFVTLPLRNTGAECVLQLPKTIKVASASGSFQSVTVVNTGTASSFKVRSGQSLSIVLGGSWPDLRVLAGAGMTAPPCADAIGDATRAEFPLGSGNLEFDWVRAWQMVCPSPPSVTVTVKL